MNKNRINYLLLLIILCVYFQAIQAKGWNGKRLKFKETTFSFGTFQQSNVMKHEFKFRNVSKQRSMIVKVSVSCGCTVIDYSTEPLESGEWGHVTITYNGISKEPGYFNKGINILTHKEIIRLEITGTTLEH